MVGEDTGPLFLLRKFPNNSPNSSNFNELSPDLSELYASTALSVKKLIVSELSSSREDVNVETMVELSNKAFETLDWLGADYADLYDAVRSLLSHCAQLSSAKSELQSHQNDESNAISYRDVLQHRCSKAFEALAGSLADRVSGSRKATWCAEHQCFKTPRGVAKAREGIGTEKEGGCCSGREMEALP